MTIVIQLARGQQVGCVFWRTVITTSGVDNDMAYEYVDTYASGARFALNDVC